ncbi:hypothetical protein [Arthrobacter sp. G119Y2]
MIEVLPATAQRFQDVSSILSPGIYVEGEPGGLTRWLMRRDLAA